MKMLCHLRRNGVAYVALFIALSGSAFAATKLAKNSVGTKQLRNGAVTYPKLRASAVDGILGRILLGTFDGPDASVCALGGGNCAAALSDARCPGTAVVTGGGWTSVTAPPASATTAYNEPDADGHGWHVIMANNNSGAGFDFAASARCIAYRAASRDVRANSGLVRAQLARELAAARARR